MTPRRPPLVLHARETVRLAPGTYLAAGERLEVIPGTRVMRLLHDLSPEAQQRRFGRVMCDLITNPNTGT